MNIIEPILLFINKINREKYQFQKYLNKFNLCEKTFSNILYKITLNKNKFNIIKL